MLAIAQLQVRAAQVVFFWEVQEGLRRRQPQPEPYTVAVAVAVVRLHLQSLQVPCQHMEVVEVLGAQTRSLSPMAVRVFSEELVAPDS